jgi:flagellar hook-associated protein 2
MFTNGINGVYAAISRIASDAADSADPGTLAGSIESFKTQQTQVATDQSTLATQQDTLRSQMMARFTVADSAITSSKSTLSFLTNQIAAWNKSGG